MEEKYCLVRKISHNNNCLKLALSNKENNLLKGRQTKEREKQPKNKD